MVEAGIGAIATLCREPPRVPPNRLCETIRHAGKFRVLRVDQDIVLLARHHARHDQHEAALAALPGIAIGMAGGVARQMLVGKMGWIEGLIADAIRDRDLDEVLVGRQPAAAMD